MANIHELSELLSNQIAAGEVIERPASVVKELVENAIDANSTQIEIQVLEAGVKAITVIDNGDGILPEDVPTAFKRHATSKITSKNDLFAIQSLGFRGEALASIAAVSKLEIKTATKSLPGVKAIFEGGQLITQQTSALRPGTMITVEQLFFNTPARLKYLKKISTELANIIDVINHLAMGYPKIAFELVSDGKTLLKTSGNNDLRQTLASIYGVSIAQQLVTIKTADLDFKVTGYIALPALTRSNRQYISMLINGRFIKNFQLNKALIQGYGSKLMVGRYPIACLNITMDPLLVDVNVHPTKQEVRLSKEKQLMTLISQAVSESLQAKNHIPNAVTNLKPQISVDQLAINLNQISQTQQATQPQATKVKPQLNENSAPYVIDTTNELQQPLDLETLTEKYAQESPPLPFGKENEQTADLEPIANFPQLEYIGQLHQTYLIAQGSDGFYLIDQHAAQERINYEYYRVKIGEVTNDQQTLLVPVVLDFQNSDFVKIQQKMTLLNQVGIQLEIFGQNSFVMHSHPTWFKTGQEASTVKETIDYLLNDGQIDLAKLQEKSAIMMSCKRAIKANHYLDKQQSQALLTQLAQCENPFNCPHGRPVLIHFSDNDLAKMFKRVQDSHQSWEGE